MEVEGAFAQSPRVSSIDPDKPYVAIARSITNQPWAYLGLSQLPASYPSVGRHHHHEVELMVDNFCALLIARIIAVVASRRTRSQLHHSTVTSGSKEGCSYTSTAVPQDYDHHIEFDGACPTTEKLPPEITPAVLSQLRSFVTFIASHYRSNFYHSIEHGHHVTICANKLLDSLLRDRYEEANNNDSAGVGGVGRSNSEDFIDDHDNGKKRVDDDNCDAFLANLCDSPVTNPAGAREIKSPTKTSLNRSISTDSNSTLGSGGGYTVLSSKTRKERNRQTYGLYSDPLAQLALIFSALIHDVDHRGITNQQLVSESDALAIMYNDQSVAEQRSISLAFCELMRTVDGPSTSAVSDDNNCNVNAGTNECDPPQYVYAELREVMFGSETVLDDANQRDNKEGWKQSPCSSDYVRFRRLVIDMVLCTDIASPERIQVGKSKYKSAFGPNNSPLSSGGNNSLRKGILSNSNISKHSSDNVDNVAAAAAAAAAAAGFCTTGEALSRLFHRQPTLVRKLSLKQKFLDTRRSLDASVLQRAVSASSDSFSSENERVLQQQQKIPQSAEQMAYHVISEATTAELGQQQFSTNDAISNKKKKEADFGVQTGKTGRTRGWFSTSLNTDLELPSARAPSQCGLPGLEKGGELLVDMLNVSHAGHRHGSSEGGTQSSLAPSPSGSGRSSRRPSAIRNGRGFASTHSSYRRFSAPVIHTATHEFRLGIRRAVNLTGSTIGLFNAANSLQNEDAELKANVVLELVLKASDVAPIMQGWQNYLEWSKRLFFEQKEAYEAGRGANPGTGWFDNQITFFDSYGMLLARNLVEVKVFGRAGDQFANNILENRRRWVVEGMSQLHCIECEWETLKLKREKEK